jgi:membrane-associated phospholipid phosphatase
MAVGRRSEEIASAAALAAALVMTNAADRYIDRVGESAPVSPDLLLSRLPTVDLSWLYWWGAAAFIALAVAAAVSRERGRWPFLARSYALVLAARAGLMTLTPLHIPAGAVSVDHGFWYSSVGRHLTTHHDLFFSMHTAMPFLGALVFRDKPVRLACGLLSILMGATVLLLKTHYSIDVAGAFLVTYALYHFQRRWLEPAIATC